ncbi:hypothetical protein ILUMI_27214 [Ignelater luminosus]|uniref:Uncharacterized protein n=1 Tax=Ignelater luminosus TaxID=2038154 RepID=A0A8K0FXX7_IGNLU|nr:hypothetical protein ILUMI_27214 [Ignelater luminosus]
MSLFKQLIKKIHNKRSIKCTTVICIDTSGSTKGNTKYFEKIKSILENEKNKLVITWNSTAEITESENFRSHGGTQPQSFLNIIKDFEYDYNLIVTTDGQIDDENVVTCKSIIDLSNILNRIQTFKMYFIGDIKEMNLRISSSFNKLKNKQFIINDDKPIDLTDITSVEDLRCNDFMNDKGVIATVLTLIQDSPDKKKELRSKMCTKATSVISELATKSSIKIFYKKNDIDGCVEFVRKYDNSEHEKFQQVMPVILDIFEETDYGEDEYSLSYFSKTEMCKKPETPDDMIYYGYSEINDRDFICDILLTKCTSACILVKLIEDSNSSNEDRFSIIPDELNKKIAEHPFLILNHDDIIQKIIKRVEHQTIDLYTYNKLKDKSRSPFTRDPLKGAFIFHSDGADYDFIFNNNNKTISFIFGKDDKLPGNKVIWNVLFLYILVKYHPVWKEHESKLKEEILYICKNMTSLITLTPKLNPIIREKLEVCLWYIFNVAPKAFGNTSNNVLGYMEGSEKFVEFYSYLYNKNLQKN